MGEQSDQILLQPIGYAWGTGNADTMVIEVDSAYADALLAVDELSHLLVLYWMHELSADVRDRLQSHPRGDTSRPIRGVFALHSPMRPNPIGVTRVELMGIDGLRLTVRGLDAHDGSPIIDLKSG
jgi:tRNA-Thr(GGU) m(6)t(6)A37 methyltransferase TsaA